MTTNRQHLLNLQPLSRIAATIFLLLISQTLFSQSFVDMSHLLDPAAPSGSRSGQRGASAVDVNNDGLVDIYHANFRDGGRLYINRGPAGFSDMLEASGINEGTNMWGAAMGDYNADGYVDILFEDLSAPSKLYRNDANFNFTEVNDIAGVAIDILAQGAAWGDFNLDGRLDFFIVNDIGPNQLFKNIDNEQFLDISISANVQTFGNSYGVSWGDINNDGFPDAYIATCHPSQALRSTNHLLLNNGDETFTNIGQSAGVSDSLAGWAVLMFDYDHDMDLDIFCSNSWHAPREGENRLYRNEGNLTFSNVSHLAGIAGGMEENNYGASLADFDNDGWTDIYVTSTSGRDRLYRNNGDGTFTDIAAANNVPTGNHRAVAVADFNDDGYIDVFLTGRPQNILLYNTPGSNHWLRITARGITNNYAGIGTRIELHSGNLHQMDEIKAGDSFCSQNLDLGAHFGLGSNTVIDSLILRWPNGLVDRYTNLTDIDRHLTFVEGGSINKRPQTFQLLSPADADTVQIDAPADLVFSWAAASDEDNDPLTYRLFLSGQALSGSSTIDTTITGTSANSIIVPLSALQSDFRYQWSVDVTDGSEITTSTDRFQFVLNPDLGPFEADTVTFLGSSELTSIAASWIDANNDGHLDLFVANTDNQPNYLFFNDGAGGFDQLTDLDIVTEANSSFGATWGDINSDGLADLFVSNTGNQNNTLHLNQGGGLFMKRTSGDIVNDGGNSMSAAWADYDNDGWLDLFVANAGNSLNYLYRNTGGGNFTKITTGEIVTSQNNAFGATWTDYNLDGFLDLFVATTRENLLYTNFGNGNFTLHTGDALASDDEPSRGGAWGDYDNDGDPDLFVINNGANSFYRNNGGSFTKINGGPETATVYDSRGGHWSDVDNDGDLDLVITNAGPNELYLNDGNGNFSAALYPLFSENNDVSHGAASGDYDNDGDQDLFVAVGSNSAVNQLLTNRRSTNNWIRINCRGSDSNTLGIGARLRLKAIINGQPVWQTREIASQSGFSSQNGLEAVFGVGDATIIDSIFVHWPFGSISNYSAIAVNQVFMVDEVPSGLDDGGANPPEAFILSQNYPNPFNPNTVIRYSLSVNRFVTLKIYDILGQEVQTLVSEVQSQGSYTVSWDGHDDQGKPVGSGLYFYQLAGEGFAISRRMLLIR